LLTPVTTESAVADGRGFLKVLVVDDILYVAKSIWRILSNEGYFVLTARTGLEAVQKFTEYRPDLVTVDRKLPDMSGLQLVEKIRETDPEGKSRIIVISAVDDKHEIQAMLKHGIDDYLVKPFKKKRLIDTVKALLDPEELESADAEEPSE
jgi:DNA-binding response OmpR family regulator